MPPHSLFFALQSQAIPLRSLQRKCDGALNAELTFPVKVEMTIRLSLVVHSNIIMANRPKPYESPQPVSLDDASANGSVSSRTLIFWLTLVLLVPLVAWAIYIAYAPLGAFLPAAIGIVVSIRRVAPVRHAVWCGALAYIVGIAAIILTNLSIEVMYGESAYNDDAWRYKAAQIHAGMGILGAVFGALIGCRSDQLPQ